MRLLSTSTTMLLLCACAAPRVVPDNGCAWVRPLVVSDDQVIVFAQHMHEMRPLADQINSQNTTRAEKCR